MHHLSKRALLFIAVCAVSSGASGQNVYKCGSVYSQSPCPGSVTVDASDTRTPAEKAQRDAATARTAQAADQMEKERLLQETKDLKANTPVAQKTVKSAPPTDKASAPKTAKKPKLTYPDKHPEAFVAVVPGTAKPHKPKTPKKKTDKQQSG